MWNNDYHSLASTSEEYAICILLVSLPIKFVDSIPAVTSKSPMLPALVRKPEICVPCDAGPIEFETLHVELSCSIFQRVRRPNIILSMYTVMGGACRGGGDGGELITGWEDEL
jgi:hypothetical protein